MGNMVKFQENENTSDESVDAGDMSPEHSADGKLNAHYHRCLVVGQSRPYAACLARCDRRLTNDDECNTAIKREGCPAQKMRALELQRGVALFFTKRGVLETIVGRVREWIAPVTGKSAPAKGTGTAPSKPARGDGMLDAIASASGDYAEVVTRIAEKERAAAPPANAVARPSSSVVAVGAAMPMTRLQILPGESPLQAARRRALQHVQG